MSTTYPASPRTTTVEPATMTATVKPATTASTEAQTNWKKTVNIQTRPNWLGGRSGSCGDYGTDFHAARHHFNGCRIEPP